MREEKARLERAAMLMFVRALRLTYRRELQILEQRERPDFMVTNRHACFIGVEITHLYHNAEEARYLNGRSYEDIHPITTVDELLDALNRGLEKKSALSYSYDTFERLLLLIRVPSPEVQKEIIIHNLERIVVPPSAFDEIWMLFYDFDRLDWADLLQLR
ncbi:MAG: hypothetical protein M3220_03180 [Chloroflexota bacterium]|nr:hypothetical protein [Chloroflexota bacterium]